MTFTTRPTLRGSFGMVATTHWIASSTAMGVLERGGNAADAAVAAGFVLHVVEPHLNGPGGDLPAIVAPAGQAPKVLCGQGPAPAAATPQRLRDLGFDEVPGSGPVAAAVPGAVDAWLVLLRDHGSLPLTEVLAPAIGYARHGAPMVERVGATVATVQRLFETEWPTSADLWLRDGRPPAPGEFVSNPAYADTLDRLCAESDAGGGSREERIERARRAWGSGFVAEAIDDAGRTEIGVQGRPQPYLVTGADMAAFSASWEAPVGIEFRGHEVLKCGAWTQGPALLQSLGMLDALGGDALDVDTPAGAHAAIEVLKLAMADREAWGGDTSPISLDALLAPAYLADRARLVGEQASLDLRPGCPEGQQPTLSSIVTDPPSVDADPGGGEPTVDASGVTRGDTCHIDVVDRWGTLISATPSGGWLQSSPVIASVGFPLGTRLQMTWLEEGLASTLTPGRRPRSTLSPTMVVREGRPWMACGTPGGDQQDQWQLVFLLRALGGMDLQEAIDAPMLHTLAFPGSFAPRRTEPGVVVAEDRFSDSLLADLERRGHEVRLSGPWSLGRLSAVALDAEGILEAAANPRGMQGYAVGR
ncbi:MAG: gamma-glutamyltransferase [Mobilicoccus sp.]|nr:gamma-glutamyltransferase [Mobilicoccus sp.]